MNLVRQEIQDLTVYRPTKQEILLNAIQSCIDQLYSAASDAQDGNEVDNYLRAAKPLTDALMAVARMGDGA